MIVNRVSPGARRLGLLTVIAIMAGTAGPVSAANFAQKCNGPPPSTQSGRASFAPGLNHNGAMQRITMKVSLFDCSPKRATRAAGQLKSTIKPNGPQTCALLNAPKTVKAAAKITWKNEKSSTLALTLTFTGRTKLMNLEGKVTAGLFKGRAVTGQFRYKLVVVPVRIYRDGSGVTEACANTLAPGQRGRIEIAAVNLYTTKHLIVT